MLRHKNNVPVENFWDCHDGCGLTACQQLLTGVDSTHGLLFFHDDILPPGASIGLHRHEGSEEVYFLLEGRATLLYDGERMPMVAGDISMVADGHSHGIENTSDAPIRLIVVGLA